MNDFATGHGVSYLRERRKIRAGIVSRRVYRTAPAGPASKLFHRRINRRLPRRDAIVPHQVFPGAERRATHRIVIDSPQ